MANIYKHIIWDWNGTLFNDVELCVKLINSVLAKRELPALSVEQYRSIFTFPVKDYYALAGLDFTKYSFEELGKEWMDEYQEQRFHAGLYSLAEEVLKKIHSNGIEQSILSAYKHDTLLEMVNHFNLRHYFTHLTGLDHIYATSKVDLGKDLMEKLNHEKGEVLLIGDTVHDFDVAKEIGVDCILIAEGHQSKSKLLACGVNVYDNMNDLMQNSKIISKGLSIN